MKITICQFDIKWEHKPCNKDRITSLLRRLDDSDPSEWVIFPEMTLTGFSMNNKNTTLSKSDIDFFREIALSRSLAVTFGGVIDGYNRSITLDRKGRIIGRYSKMHLFTYAGEHKFYKPGNKIVNFKLNGFGITPFVCYDLRFPYLFNRKARMTDIFPVIANWPSMRIGQWTALLMARAIENQAYVVGVNRIGKSPKLDYCGGSTVLGPDGRVLLDCGNKEGIFSIDILKETVASTRRGFQFLKDNKEA